MAVIDILKERHEESALCALADCLAQRGREPEVYRVLGHILLNRRQAYVKRLASKIVNEFDPLGALLALFSRELRESRYARYRAALQIMQG